MAINDCYWLDINHVEDSRGLLCIMEEGAEIPFSIKRIYFLSQVPLTSGRGGHAHKELQQVFCAVSGAFTITVDDGRERQSFVLDNPRKGLYLPKMVWRDIDGFSDNAVCMVVASELYDEADYFREYTDFLRAANTE